MTRGSGYNPGRHPGGHSATVERFAAACRADPLVLAAFLGGSYAGGSADAYSDLDLYVVTRPQDHAALCARREEFVRSWSVPLFLDTTVDFEGLGFDMVHFVLATGEYGEVALGHLGVLAQMHGGAFETLVDEESVLTGVTFPLVEPTVEERQEACRRALTWFWYEALAVAARIARHRPAAAASGLHRLHGRCLALVEASGDPSLGALLDAAWAGRGPEPWDVLVRLAAVHRTVGSRVAVRLRQPYPLELADRVEATMRAFEGQSGRAPG